MAQQLTVRRTVDLRRLDQLARDVLDAGNIDNHHITDLLPVHQNYESPESVGSGIGKRLSEVCQNTV